MATSAAVTLGAERKEISYPSVGYFSCQEFSGALWIHHFPQALSAWGNISILVVPSPLGWDYFGIVQGVPAMAGVALDELFKVLSHSKHSMIF